ncbi:unnamed protein product [Moneuplotes crassus]|uniref:Uncharacterized protein n=1 Tax=Euplotes crassus TaxID=5936 RepID=A0AAD2D3S2_EUPCR|nr:unnamed protein product [Moneuplotes crassus]
MEPLLCNTEEAFFIKREKEIQKDEDLRVQLLKIEIKVFFGSKVEAPSFYLCVRPHLLLQSLHQNILGRELDYDTLGSLRRYKLTLFNNKKRSRTAEKYLKISRPSGSFLTLKVSDKSLKALRTKTERNIENLQIYCEGKPSSFGISSWVYVMKIAPSVIFSFAIYLR